PNEPSSPSSPTTTTADITLRLGLNQGSTSSSRTQRPLYSTDDWQQCSNVRIYLFESATEDGPFVYYRPLDRNNAGVSVPYIYVKAFEKDEVWTVQNIEYHVYSLQGYKLNANRWYKLLAVGRDDLDETLETNGTPQAARPTRYWSLHDPTLSPYAADGTTPRDSLIEGKTTLEDVRLTSLAGPTTPSEIFTGLSHEENSTALSYNGVGMAVQSDKEGRLGVDITMYRAVAGVLLYVNNLETTVATDVYRSGVALEANSDLTNSIKAHNRQCADAVGTIAQRRILTTTVNDAAYQDACDKKNDGVYVLDAYYVNINTNTESKFKDALPLVATFMVPQPIPAFQEPDNDLEAVASQSTFRFCFLTRDYEKDANTGDYLFNADGSYKSTESIITEKPVKIDSGSKVDWSDNITYEGKYVFPILANNFYHIGNYNVSDGTDTPFDLVDMTDVIIGVGSWQIIFDINMDWVD
ncbi:MAG: hypothetical protein LIO90_01510, partial [Bacteroidales bacterium]|nr:hypothetical protein [Bacteroidales bacterium]